MPPNPAPKSMTPTPDEVEAYRDAVGAGPVVMLNLLKFKSAGGREAFAEYGALSGPLVARQGGEVFYLSDVGPNLAGDDWDVVVMVRFPDFDAFAGLIADPEYQAKAHGLRERALERTLWSFTQPPADSAEPAGG